MVRFALTTALTALMFVGCAKQPAEEVAPAGSAEVAPGKAAQSTSANAFAFSIGDLSAYALRDGYFEFPNDLGIFGLGRTQEEVDAVLAAEGLPTDKLMLSVQPLLVKAADRVLLFDTGPAGLFGPTSGHVSKAFAEAGIDPQAVTDLFISHSHGDHAGGLVNAEGKLVYPKATIHLAGPEWEFMSANDQYKPWLATLTPKVNAFAPGAELVPGVVRAVEIEGHTPGHSGYRITSGADSLLYVGDTVHHYVISVQRPDWSMGFDGDQARGAQSRAALIGDMEASGQRIYSVHFPFPGIGKFAKRGDGYAWVAE